MQDKKNELINKMKKLDADIKEIYNLRSTIVNGKFIIDKTKSKKKY